MSPTPQKNKNILLLERCEKEFAAHEIRMKEEKAEYLINFGYRDAFFSGFNAGMKAASANYGISYQESMRRV